MIPPDRVTASETGAVRRPAPAPGRPSVLVIGAGIAGCCLAYALAQRGVATVLVDRGRVGRLGASAVGAALLNPYRGRSGKPGPYDLAGLSAFWRMTDELRAAGGQPGATRSGVLRIASNARQARSWQELPGMLRQKDLPLPYRAPAGAFLVEDGGWVEPRQLLHALVSAARDGGVEVIEECEVERLDRHEGAWRAHTERGAVVGSFVALCLGAGSIAGVELPHLERVAGDQITLASDAPLPFPIAGSIYLASTGSRVLIGGNHRDPATRDPHAPELLRASAARMVPPLAEAPIVKVWTGIRAKRSDNLPLVDELEPGLWFLGAFGGRGFLTAPLLAGRLADHLAKP